jgi:hypothetical protein
MRKQQGIVRVWSQQKSEAVPCSADTPDSYRDVVKNKTAPNMGLQNGGKVLN